MNHGDQLQVAKTIARNIKELRESNGISQEELAYRAGIDRTFVSQIERAVANPSLKTLLALAGVLGVSVVQLFSANSQRQ